MLSVAEPLCKHALEICEKATPGRPSRHRLGLTEMSDDAAVEPPASVDVIFPVRVQGLAELAGVPYVGVHS